MPRPRDRSLLPSVVAGTALSALQYSLILPKRLGRVDLLWRLPTREDVEVRESGYRLESRRVDELLSALLRYIERQEQASR